jgi:hypothetical protein
MAELAPGIFERQEKGLLSTETPLSSKSGSSKGTRRKFSTPLRPLASGCDYDVHIFDMSLSFYISHVGESGLNKWTGGRSPITWLRAWMVRAACSMMVRIAEWTNGAPWVIFRRQMRGFLCIIHRLLR